MTPYEQQQAADVQGMIDAEQRHSGSMSGSEIMQQYKEIQARPIPVAAPKPIESEPETITISPAVVAAAKLVGVAGGVVILFKTVAVGMATIFAFIEANAGVAVAVVMGGVALIGFSASRSSVGSTGGYSDRSSQHQCGCRGTTIIQDNNFGGGNANQNTTP